jgi:hypothetical protein
VSATTFLFIILIAAAFWVGYLVRGGGRGRGTGRKRGKFHDVIEDGRAALDAAHMASEACDAIGITNAGRRLKTVERTLTTRLGADHPLVDDLSQAREALSLIEDDVRDGATEPGPLASVVRDARARYRRSAEAIEKLPDE